MMCLHATIAGLFFRLGCLVDRRPVAVLGAACGGALGCMLGLVWLTVVVDYEALWIPHTVESWPDKVAFEGAFGRPDRRLVALVTSAPDARGGGDMLISINLQAAHAVHEMVTGVAGYDRLCTKAWEPDGPCVVSSVLAAWGFARPSGDVGAVLSACHSSIKRARIQDPEEFAWIYCSTLQCDLQGTDRRNW